MSAFQTWMMQQPSTTDFVATPHGFILSRDNHLKLKHQHITLTLQTITDSRLQHGFHLGFELLPSFRFLPCKCHPNSCHTRTNRLVEHWTWWTRFAYSAVVFMLSMLHRFCISEHCYMDFSVRKGTASQTSTSTNWGSGFSSWCSRCISWSKHVIAAGPATLLELQGFHMKSRAPMLRAE